MTPEERRAARLASQKRWRDANREHRAAEHKKWRKNNRERAQQITNEAVARWEARNPEKKKERLAAWQRANPEAVRDAQHRRRARLTGSEPDLTPAEWQEILDEFDHACAYCHARGVRLEQEHVTPISRGGRHTATNVVPACRSCNARKGAKNLFEFAGMALT